MFRKFTLAAIAVAIGGIAVARPSEKSALNLVVMDPLALPLSCPCVKGYAQRDYEQLGTYLEQRLSRPVKVSFSESLVSALKDKTNGKADLVIGKFSLSISTPSARAYRSRPSLPSREKTARRR